MLDERENLTLMYVELASVPSTPRSTSFAPHNTALKDIFWSHKPRAQRARVEAYAIVPVSLSEANWSDFPQGPQS